VGNLGAYIEAAEREELLPDSASRTGKKRPKNPRFNKVEFADMHFVCDFCDGNSLAALSEYQHEPPDRNQPHRRELI
jgi:hypothetical protein